MKIRKSTAATIAGATALLAAGSVGGAFAGNLINTNNIANGAVTNTKIAANAVGGGKIMNDAIGANKLAPGVRAQLNTHATNGKNGAPGTDGKDGAPGTAGQNAFVGIQNFGNPTPGTGVTIANIGGRFATNATTVNTFELKAGTYLINSNADFERNSATSTSTPTLMLALRATDGSDYGTCFTGEFPYSPAQSGHLDQNCSGSQLVTVPAGGTTVSIKAFGYNADTSGNGGGDFQVWTNVNVLQINTN